MYMNTNLSFAIKYATEWHNGVVDKAGKPYILHPLRVMLKMDTEEEQVVALLHDVVEDTSCTLLQIGAEFGEAVAEAVDAISRRTNETYFAYIYRVKENSVARKVKIADIFDNMSPDRVYQPEELQRSNNIRYEKALRILQGL